jgi:hypothetical protein
MRQEVKQADQRFLQVPVQHKWGNSEKTRYLSYRLYQRRARMKARRTMKGMMKEDLHMRIHRF